MLILSFFCRIGHTTKKHSQAHSTGNMGIYVGLKRKENYGDVVDQEKEEETATAERIEEEGKAESLDRDKFLKVSGKFRKVLSFDSNFSKNTIFPSEVLV